MSDPKKKRKSRARKGAAGAPPAEAAERPTLISVCDNVSRVLDGEAAKHGFRAVVILYDPAQRNYQADFRGSPPDIASMMCLRAGLRIMGQIG